LFFLCFTLSSKSIADFGVFKKCVAAKRRKKRKIKNRVSIYSMVD
jgi:hypothetical protein